MGCIILFISRVLSLLFLLFFICGSDYKSIYSVNGIEFKFPDDPETISTHNEADISLGVHEASYRREGFLYHVAARQYDADGNQHDWAHFIGSHMPGRNNFI